MSSLHGLPSDGVRIGCGGPCADAGIADHADRAHRPPAGRPRAGDPVGRRNLARDPTRPVRVTDVDLFSDPVHVLAVTKLARRLLTDLTVAGVAQTALLWAMVWVAWVHATWFTGWAAPRPAPGADHPAGAAGRGSRLAATIPEAFPSRGLAVATA